MHSSFHNAFLSLYFYGKTVIQSSNSGVKSSGPCCCAFQCCLQHTRTSSKLREVLFPASSPAECPKSSSASKESECIRIASVLIHADMIYCRYLMISHKFLSTKKHIGRMWSEKWLFQFRFWGSPCPAPLFSASHGDTGRPGVPACPAPPTRGCTESALDW